MTLKGFPHYLPIVGESIGHQRAPKIHLLQDKMAAILADDTFKCILMKMTESR